MVPEIWSVTQFFGFFALLSPYGPKKSKFLKNEKKKTNVYLEGQAYDVWLLRYGVQWTQFFVILGHFLPFCLSPP